MAKKIIFEPIETIELEFNDNVTKKLLFNTKAVKIIESEFEGGVFGVSREVYNKPYESGAKIVYAGMKVCDDNITFDEVKALILQLPFSVITELVGEFTANLNGNTSADAKMSDDLKKTIMLEMLKK